MNTNELKVGDLVYYKDYFCIITAITVSSLPVNYTYAPTVPDNRFDRLHLVRKYRSDGSLIKKTKWSDYTWRYAAKPPDVLFRDIISRNKQLLETYKTIV